MTANAVFAEARRARLLRRRDRSPDCTENQSKNAYAFHNSLLETWFVRADAGGHSGIIRPVSTVLRFGDSVVSRAFVAPLLVRHEPIENRLPDQRLSILGQKEIGVAEVERSLIIG